MPGHDCDAPATVEVKHDGEWVGIPIIDDGVTVHERKDGPLSLSRRAEVTFPLTDGTTDWVDFINGYTDGGQVQQARVSMQRLQLDGTSEGDHIPLIHGYISSVGSRSGHNQGQFTIMGPFQLVNNIPASHTFMTGADPIDILRWAAEEYINEQPIFDNIGLPDELQDETTDSVRLEFNIPGIFITDYQIPTDVVSIGQPKTFKPNRDTLADVFKWVISNTNYRVWFDPLPDGSIVLRMDRAPGRDYNGIETDATGDPFDVYPINNDAIFEMRPENAITLRGSDRGPVDIDETTFLFTVPAIWSAVAGDGQYPEATAYYPPLVERAGGRIARQGTSEAGTEEAVGEEARSRLKEQLDEVSGGTMSLALAPQLTPFDRITAKPACAGIINRDFPSLDYEVQRTAHTLAPNNKENNIPQTEVAVSMSVDPELIEVDTTTKSMTPSDGGDNTPPPEEAVPGVDVEWDFMSP